MKGLHISFIILAVIFVAIVFIVFFVAGQAQEKGDVTNKQLTFITKCNEWRKPPNSCAEIKLPIAFGLDNVYLCDDGDSGRLFTMEQCITICKNECNIIV